MVKVTKRIVRKQAVEHGDGCKVSGTSQYFFDGSGWGKDIPWNGGRSSRRKRGISSSHSPTTPSIFQENLFRETRRGATCFLCCRHAQYVVVPPFLVRKGNQLGKPPNPNHQKNKAVHKKQKWKKKSCLNRLQEGICQGTTATNPGKRKHWVRKGDGIGLGDGMGWEPVGLSPPRSRPVRTCRPASGNGASLP